MIVVPRSRVGSVSVTDELSYDVVGRSLGPLPAGWHHVERSWELPAGSFDTAAACVLSWSMHRGAGLIMEAATPRAVTGIVVRQGFPIGPLAIVAPCRVLSVVDDPDARGFTYGTLRGHPESGEESFVVRRDGQRVWLEIRSYSRPGSRLVAAGNAVNHRAQARAVGRFGATVVAACA